MYPFTRDIELRIVRVRCGSDENSKQKLPDRRPRRAQDGASERSICDSVRNAIAVANAHDFERVALPVIGAGSGGFNEERALELIVRTLRDLAYTGQATVVRYRANVQLEGT